MALLLLVPAALAAAGSAQRVEVTWQPVERELPFTGHLAEGETRTVTVDATGMNLTSVTAKLTWSETGDDVGVSGPDTFRLSGHDPAGDRLAGSPATGDEGALRVEAPRVNPVPVPFEVETTDPHEARERADEAAPTRGEGTWRFTVTLRGTANPDGTQVDEGNRYTLTVTMRSVEANLMRVVALDDPNQGTDGGDIAPPPSSSTWRWTALGLGVAASGLGLVLAREARRDP